MTINCQLWYFKMQIEKKPFTSTQNLSKEWSSSKHLKQISQNFLKKVLIQPNINANIDSKLYKLIKKIRNTTAKLQNWTALLLVEQIFYMRVKDFILCLLLKILVTMFIIWHLSVSRDNVAQRVPQSWAGAMVILICPMVMIPFSALLVESKEKDKSIQYEYCCRSCQKMTQHTTHLHLGTQLRLS